MNKRSDNLLVFAMLAVMVVAGLWFLLIPALSGGNDSLSTGQTSVASNAQDGQDASEWGDDPPTIDATIAVAELPTEAWDTIALIETDGPFPYQKDGSVFQNREGLLPDHDMGWYREYTVDTPGSSDRGARRIVGGSDGVLYWTADHYDSFAEIRGR